MSVHACSQAAFGTETSELYNNARPQYPPEPLSHLRRAFSSEPIDIVEIAAGTGIFTRALLEHPEWGCICRVKAIEPSEGMRETLVRYTEDPRVVVSSGTFDNSGVEEGWADMTVIAHAFQWCSDYEAAAVEFARVLKPGGVLALTWNHEDRDAAPWLDKVRERVERGEEWPPHWRTKTWRQLFETRSYRRFFTQPEEREFAYHISGTVSGVVRRGLSSSHIAALSNAEKEAFAEEVERIVQEGEGIVWVDEKEGIFQYPHKVELILTRRV